MRKLLFVVATVSCFAACAGAEVPVPLLDPGTVHHSTSDEVILTSVVPSEAHAAPVEAASKRVAPATIEVTSAPPLPHAESAKQVPSPATPEAVDPTPPPAAVWAELLTGNARFVLGAPANHDLASLRGRVVLIDFWTYSCVNCLRTLPYLRRWDDAYRADGLTIVGVHTPEFAFERDAGNVRDAVASLGLRYPVALDSDYGTWNAWGNRYWPAKYLIDREGHVRFAHFGEGDYGETEAAIRELLAEPGLPAPVSGEVTDMTPENRAVVRAEVLQLLESDQ